MGQPAANEAATGNANQGAKPVVHNNMDPETKKRVDGLEDYISQQIAINLTQWSVEADKAVQSAHLPKQENSRFYFYVALGGNLVWAATCLLQPEAAIAIRVMSFGGAAVGSGAVEQLAPDSEVVDEEGAKDLIREQLSLFRGRLETQYSDKWRDWAVELERREAAAPPGTPHETLLKQRIKYIWSQMFKDIPYNDDRYNAVRANMLSSINGCLSDFNLQWEEWRRSVAYEGEALRKQRGHTFKPRLRFWLNGKMYGPPAVYNVSGVYIQIDESGSVQVSNNGRFAPKFQ